MTTTLPETLPQGGDPARVRARPGAAPPYERQILRAGLLAVFPPTLIALALLWTGDHPPKVCWTLTAALVAASAGLPFYLRERVSYRLRSIASVLSALREGDYTTGMERSAADDSLGDVIAEVHALRDVLGRERSGAAEAGALLEKVMERIDVAVFAFDESGRLALVNARGASLFGETVAGLLGQPAGALGLEECLEGPAPRVENLELGGRPGRWEVRRASFRARGLPHRLLVLSDLTAALRDQEREAWGRLLRVLRHEVNNSLAPVHSLAGTLADLVRRRPRPPDWEEDLAEGLAVIADRSSALNRLLASYSRLAGLPPPAKRPVEVAGWVRRVAALETRTPVRVDPGPTVELLADPDQLDQLLINLVRNAADASLPTGGPVRIGWEVRPGGAGGGQRRVLEVRVEDEGPGVVNPQNLFVPFFTTKPGGSGVGLTLCREIAEAHDGSLTLDNRPGGAGCRATLQLPL
jgi:signal transduction histidine kinase